MKEQENVVHRSDNDYNKYVRKIIGDAKRAKDARDFMDYMMDGKTWKDIEEKRFEDIKEIKGDKENFRSTDVVVEKNEEEER